MVNSPACVVRIQNLTKRYSATSLGVEDISLDIVEGEIFGFLGTNGAGKSTTINMMLDLLRPTSGTIELFGRNAHTHGVALRRRIGYVSGDMTTDLAMTGQQYLSFAAKQYGGIDEVYLNYLVAMFRVETNRQIKQLSRGNRQKIGLVAALMHKPDLLILDEPTSGLDPIGQEQFNLILAERKKDGKTTFMSSHILSEIQANCDRIGIIRDGHLVRVGTVDELIGDRPRHVEVEMAQKIVQGDLSLLPGVNDIEITGSVVRFTFSGDYNSLLTWLAQYTVVDLEIEQPSLDELFLQYYASEKGRTRA